MQNSQKSYTVETATRALERYCAYQERCHKDVNDKLKKMGMIDDAIDQIIPHLLQHDFLNETRYAQAFARGKFRIKKWGRQRITRELKARGLNKKTIDRGLAEISDDDYRLTFDKLSRKRNQQLTETDKYKRRKKLADYLLYRGWESHLVYAKAKELVP
ncbi:regulatory protein RecX [Nonlabens ponticola]|uniref:Regulatory protein RecX n=1 Tax=Nonlabens ponticola TaxID=2496866 RepID=A0A3S9MVV7_9FLAO|nr:regulatory protein RecX [Nonlabens ponticola]AZQ43267.1 RecX family transcriptional regulator [Nonlabens ponticola]